MASSMTLMGTDCDDTEDGIGDHENSLKRVNVEIGFFEKDEEDGDTVGNPSMHEDGNWLRWEEGRAGGKPIWLHPFKANDIQPLLRCKNCSGFMSFFLQIYAPLDGYSFKHAFHRALYLFICRNKDNRTLQCDKSTVVLRGQLPRKNNFYCFNAGTENEDIDCHFDRTVMLPELTLGDEFPVRRIITESEPSKSASKCAYCSRPATARCQACRAEVYCCREHQKKHWSKHKDICKMLRDELSWPASESAEDAECSQEQFDEMIAGENKEMQKKLTRDPFFESFRARVARDPSQCVRYCRWASDGSIATVLNQENTFGPLWLSLRDQVKEISPCLSCGAPCKFELQVLPQSLYFLNSVDVDFGTICVYTCTKSCFLPPNEYGLETAHVQLIG